MAEKQLGLWQFRSEKCPFQELLEEDDNHCFSFGRSKDDYEVLSEDAPFFANWLADIRNVGFADIVAKPTPQIDIPPFVPMIRRGSQKLLVGNKVPFVAVTLRDIVSPTELLVASDIKKRLGVSPATRVILLSYAKDQLIEKLWARREVVFSKIAALGFDLVTAVNYSVWLNHPHGERLINLKRSLITFKELQEHGAPAVPHVYWTGKKDLARWADWLKINPGVSMIAINLQTERERGNLVWNQTVEDLKYFSSILDRQLHFLITGPSKPERIRQIGHILPSFSLTNAVPARKAASSFLIKEGLGKHIYRHTGDLGKSEILRRNIGVYKKIMQIKPTVSRRSIIKPYAKMGDGQPIIHYASHPHLFKPDEHQTTEAERKEKIASCSY